MVAPGKQYTKPTWLSELQIGSYRGVKFYTNTDVLETGRRLAIHEYPYRDQPWVEDMGLATKYYEFDAYLWANESQGQVVWDLRNALLKAVEAEGADTLVHPSLGAVEAQLQMASFLEDADGGIVKVKMKFVESALYSFQGLAPYATPDTVNDVITAAGNAIDGAVNSFQNLMQNTSIQLTLG